MEADPNGIIIEGFGAPGLSDNTIIRFIDLVLSQSIREGATEIGFAREQKSEADKPTTAPADDLFDDLMDSEFEALLSEPHRLFEDDFSGDRPSHRFVFTIKCVTPAGSRQRPPPPPCLYVPVVNCLCAMSDIRYWARGPVAGFIDLKIGGLGRIPWTVHSPNLLEQITLSRATAEQIAAFDRRQPIAVPPLPGPLPDVPLPEFIFRPVSPPTRLHAVVWFVSRTVFYAFAYIEVFSLVKFNASLGDALSTWLGKMFALAAKIMELPIFILSMDEYPGLQEWGWIQFLVWGTGLAYLAQRSTKRKA